LKTLDPEAEKRAILAKSCMELQLSSGNVLAAKQKVGLKGAQRIRGEFPVH
jgi:hypothetical protein